MPKLQLTYFDFDGGRGEPARLACYIGGVDFEDDRFSFPEWKDRKPSTPFHQVPVLTVDGTPVTQCNSINRYVGKLSGLYPEDPVQALLCDEAMDVIEDIGTQVVATFGIDDPEELKAKRAALVEGPLSTFLRGLNGILEARGGEYFADGRLTVADLKVFLWVRHLKSGNLDHVPADLADRIAPLLAQHFERVRTNPKVAEYYAARAAAK